jgi:hypothetical protein
MSRSFAVDAGVRVAPCGGRFQQFAHGRVGGANLRAQHSRIGDRCRHTGT